jgi:hypothetical protein
LLPFRIEDARRQLELDGDFSFEALTLLREAEEERRGKTTSTQMIKVYFYFDVRST